MCDSSLLDNHEAVVAFSEGDNMNASVPWGDDDMQAYGHVDELLSRMAHSQVAEVVTTTHVMASLQVTGFRHFTQDQ